MIKPFSQHLKQIEKLLAQESNSSHFAFINNAAKQITLDEGKRLRPVLVLATAYMLGGVTPRHITFAAVMELIHTATLLHDDVLDDADVRRHRPSINSQWGNATSVLLGDYLFARALMLLASLGSTELFGLVSQATSDICEGELLQINGSRNLNLTRDEYFEMIRKKTASLFAACCKGSAIISNADSKAAAEIEGYGCNIGLAFQIADDILDIMGDPLSEGKTLGTDIKKGKVTLPLIYLMPHLNSKEKGFLEDVVTQKTLDISTARLSELLTHKQGLGETVKTISSLCELAVTHLKSFANSSECDLFHAIPNYILARARAHLEESVVS